MTTAMQDIGLTTVWVIIPVFVVSKKYIVNLEHCDILF